MNWMGMSIKMADILVIYVVRICQRYIVEVDVEYSWDYSIEMWV